jgi:hypothetical protein
MNAIADLIDELKKTHGLALEFDEQGRCALEHEDDFTILIALRDESREVKFAVVVSYLTTTEPADLLADLLKHNLKGTLTGPFAFALDAAGGRVLLTGRASVADLTPERFMRTLDLLVATREKVAAAVDGAQVDGSSLDEIIAGSRDAPSEGDVSRDDAPPWPGQFV